MAFTGFSRGGYEWFRALAIAQNREWFKENRAPYEGLWVEPMKALLAELEPKLKKLYGKKLGPKKIFRLNRDVRFSNDKTPYKTSISSMIPFEGRAGPMEGPAAFYLQLGLGEQVLAAGFYWLEGAKLQRLRKAALDEKIGPKLQKLVDGAKAAGMALDAHQVLKRPPPGVDKLHPRLELLRHKGLAFSRTELPQKIVCSKALVPWLLEQLSAAAPALAWGFKNGLR